MWRKELKDGVTDFGFSNISPYRTKSVLAGTQDGNLARGISCFKYQDPVSMTNRVLGCTHKMWFKGSKLCHALGNAFLQYVAVLLVLTWRWSWSGALLAGLLAGWSHARCGEGLQSLSCSSSSCLPRGQSSPSSCSPLWATVVTCGA